MERTISESDIERLIDTMGIDSVLADIGGICAEKAEHIRHNWQDGTLARRWDTISTRLFAISSDAFGL